MAKKNKWEVVDVNSTIDRFDRTDRLKIKGGWIYRVTCIGPSGVATASATCFVPEK